MQYAFGPETVNLVSASPQELVEKLTVASIDLQNTFSQLKPLSLDMPPFEMTHWHSNQQSPLQTGSASGFHFPSLGGYMPLMNLFSHNHFIGYGGICGANCCQLLIYIYIYMSRAFSIVINCDIPYRWLLFVFIRENVCGTDLARSISF